MAEIFRRKLFGQELGVRAKLPMILHESGDLEGRLRQLADPHTLFRNGQLYPRFW